MANNYFANQNPNDIAIQSEDGGGMIFTKQGKFLFGAKLPEINEQLNEEFYQGNVDVNPNTNSSFIGIMNANSEPIDVDIPSTNQYSLFTPPENVVVEPNPPKDDCANEFDDVADALLKTAALFYDDFALNGNNIAQPSVTNKSQISDRKFQKAKKLLLDYFWNSNNSRRIKPLLGTDDPEINQLVSSNSDKLIVNNLPPGLRDLYLTVYFALRDIPFRYILATVGPNGINAKDKDGNSLGIPYEQNTVSYESKDSYIYKISDNNGNLTNELIYDYEAPNIPPGAKVLIRGYKVLEIYLNNFSEIINTYNNNKAQFLEEFKKVIIRFIKEEYNKLKIENKNDPTKLEINKRYYDYNIAVVNAVYDVALKYINCPIDDQMTSTTVKPNPNQSTQSTPPPSPTPPVSLTAAEIEEGIYEANFLPASEDEGFQLFDLTPMLDIDEVLIFEGGVARGEEVKIVNGVKVKTNTTTKNVGVVGKNAKEKIKNFFDKYMTDTLAAVNGSYVFPEVKLAQAIKESGYGKHVINIGNFFGITKGGWKGDYGLYTTHEAGPNYRVDTNIGEINYKQQDDRGWLYKRAFRHYKSVEEGFRDHTTILENKYYTGYDEIGNPIGQGKHIGKVYATSPTYSESLAVIINELIPLFKDKYTVTKVGNKYKITVP